MSPALIIYGNPVCSPRVLKPKLLTYIVSDSSLTSLTLSHNSLTNLSFINSLSNLTFLDVSYNQISIVNCTSNSLLHLNISFNYLTDLPAFQSLIHLEANSNNITSLFSLPNLISLFVASNQISQFPTSALFPNLCILAIDENPIASSPDLRILFLLPKLKMYNYQKLSSQTHMKAQSAYSGVVFEEDIESLIPQDKDSIDLSEKGLKEVSVLSGKHVASLFLNNNAISDISWTQSSFPNLKHLYLTHNVLQSFSFVTFLPKLASLDLSFNKLTDANLVNFASFKFPSLKELNLSNNNFRILDVFSSKNFPCLEYLNLSRNHINKIQPQAITSLTLQTLDISYNSLKQLNGLGIPSILTMDVSHNRINSVDEVEKLIPCAKIMRFFFMEQPLSQRISPRIRCLVILRSLQELDGRAVSESDLSQVRMHLEQNCSSFSSMSSVSNIILQPSGLPILQQNQSKRQAFVPQPKNLRYGSK